MLTETKQRYNPEEEEDHDVLPQKCPNPTISRITGIYFLERRRRSAKSAPASPPNEADGDVKQRKIYALFSFQYILRIL